MLFFCFTEIQEMPLLSKKFTCPRLTSSGILSENHYHLSMGRGGTTVMSPDEILFGDFSRREGNEQREREQRRQAQEAAKAAADRYAGFLDYCRNGGVMQGRPLPKQNGSFLITQGGELSCPGSRTNKRYQGFIGVGTDPKNGEITYLGVTTYGPGNNPLQNANIESSGDDLAAVIKAVNKKLATKQRRSKSRDTYEPVNPSMPAEIVESDVAVALEALLQS